MHSLTLRCTSCFEYTPGDNKDRKDTGQTVNLHSIFIRYECRLTQKVQSIFAADFIHLINHQMNFLFYANDHLRNALIVYVNGLGGIVLPPEQMHFPHFGFCVIVGHGLAIACLKFH